MEVFSEKTRDYFPSLNRVNSSNQQIIYLDGPGGTQVPIQVIEAISQYYLRSNANTHGEFITSQETDLVMDDLDLKFLLCLGQKVQHNFNWSKHDHIKLQFGKSFIKKI